MNCRLAYRLAAILWISLSSAAFAADGLKFSHRLLAVDANEGIAVADFNNDGKLDVAAGRNWYAAPDFVARPVRPINDWNGYVESNGDFAYDVDGDGWTDIIAGQFIGTEVHWYRNPGAAALKLGQQWPRHLLVDTKLSQNEASFLRDVTGDEKPEWISNSWNKKNPTVVWRLDKADDNSPTLTKHVVGPNVNGHGMGFGDINNDGREDIVIESGWFERPEADAWKQPWTFHADWKPLHASCPMIVRDIDNDGKNDLIFGYGHKYGLLWWQNLGAGDDGKLQFKEHQIDDSFSQPHTIHFADLDGDGNDELITGKRVRAHNGKDPGGSEPPCMYYYQWNDKMAKFERFVIDEGHIGTGLQIRTGDLNGDGKLDIAVAGKDGTWILFNQGAATGGS